ncbi:MAG: hypothetical protein II901_01715 [Paludibacteraceae bacterium]|nr:hypothetical protein [Paludibacteraceae bacterium]
MKKIIYFFLAASTMMLVACGGGADANYDEQNIQKTATTLRSLLKKGASPEEVDQALIKAGFVRKADDEPSLSPAARAPKMYDLVATYFLNAPEDFQGYLDYDGEEDPKRIVGFNRIVASNRIFAEVYLNFGTFGKLRTFIIDFVMNKDLAQDHSLFIKLDNAIYNELDLEPNTFEGTLYNSYKDCVNKQNSQTFSDREKYFAAITNLQSVYTYATYDIFLGGSEYRTTMGWRNLSDEVYSEENASKLGYKPYVAGRIGISGLIRID